MIKLKPLLLSLLISLGTGGLAALFTGNSMEFYQSLKQPPLSPPGWVFPLAWTILYSLMGVAAYLVWMRDSTGRNGALFFYGLQLIFNFVWPLLFFNARAYLASLIWLLLLWVLILITTARSGLPSPVTATPASGCSTANLPGSGRSGQPE